MSLVQGRFAPSPTGPLHMGSMLAALGSYLHTKSQNGKWFVRIEDLDPPREMKDAAASILQTLDCFGLHWDGDVSYQSQRNDSYEAALQKLNENHLLYSCYCSRKEIKATARNGILGAIYPRTCRNKIHIGKQSEKKTNNVTTRLKTNNATISFADFLQGEIKQNVEKEVGDVVLKRADGLFSYHLAVVVDDYEQNITEIVRGIDLLDCTPIQIYLRQCLYTNFSNAEAPSQPQYLHLPIIVNQHGEKLSKQTKAQAVSTKNVEKTLLTLLGYLNQKPPKTLIYEGKTNILDWAIRHWDATQIQGIKSIRTNFKSCQLR